MVKGGKLASRLAAIEKYEATLYAIADLLECMARIIRETVDAIRKEREGTP